MRKTKIPRFIIGNSSYAFNESNIADGIKDSIFIASSPCFIIVASVMYLSIIVALLLTDCYWWLRLIFLLVLLIEFKLVIYLYGIREHKFAVIILKKDCDRWLYKLNSGKIYAGKILKQRSFCGSFVIILYIKHFIGGRYIVIPRDSLSKRNYRLLAFELNCL